LVFKLKKWRRNFYTQIRFWSFHGLIEKLEVAAASMSAVLVLAAAIQNLARINF